MTLELGISGIVCLIGLLLYALSSNGRVQEIGRIMFFAGLLVSLLGMHELVGGSLKMR